MKNVTHKGTIERKEHVVFQKKTFTGKNVRFQGSIVNSIWTCSNEIVIPNEITIPKMDFQDVCIFPNEIIMMDSPAMSPLAVQISKTW